jgi:Flp pilus assembly protein TadG
MWRSFISFARDVGASGFLRSRRGAAAAEFALIFPVFMLSLFGITAFASTLFLENNMVNAARESVRQMAVLEAPFAANPVQCDSGQAQTVGTAEYVACSYLTFWGTDFTVQAGDTCAVGGDKATVRITLDASQGALMDIFGFFNGKTLTAEVSMRKEDPCA